ncbi:chitin synthase/hyaluronan synthase [Moesziomyces antarcticus T-34]|uniref:chitin synthase n=1 Tax=Pseudozyma antarctica (strain T-34) TaxID=1151754 RepID=M9LZ64_PSEA3|nr:chitin synthase/hyaluronan synthase [Moesziomyces antarcticus T-34]
MADQGEDDSKAAQPHQQEEAAASSSTASTSRTPFQFAPVPARFRRHLEVSVPPPPPARRPTHRSSRRSSLTGSASSDGEEDDDFDEGRLNRFRFSRGYSSGWSANPAGTVPSTPTTPMTPLTPMTPGMHRPGSTYGSEKRKSGLSGQPFVLSQQEAVVATAAVEVETEVELAEDGTDAPAQSQAEAKEEEGSQEEHVERASTDPSRRSSIPESLSSDSEPAHSNSQSTHTESGPDALQTWLRARPTEPSGPTTTEVDPFSDSNEAPTDPFASPQDIQPVNDLDKDRDAEKIGMASQGVKMAFDQDKFPDYAPLVPSRVTAGRYGLIMAIGALNMGLVILFLFLAPAGASLVVMVALKSRDILSVVWQSLLFLLSVAAMPFRKKKPKVIHPPRKIVSLVPVYKESTQDVLDTVDSIIQDNPVRPQDFNIIAIMADGFDVEDDVIVQETICRVEDSPYFSWKIRESAFRLQFGYRMNHPIMIVRKVKNAGKKDSLIFAFDLFNSDNEATGHCNAEARAMVLDHIRRLYNQPDLEYFDFVFCTDADTKILAGSVNVLADRLMDEGEKTVGACGIVEADFHKPGRSLRTCGLWYYWDHFQGFQYTYGQWIRRRSESSWGRVTCMPGAITMLRTGSILGQASGEYRKHVQNGNLVNRQVQYQGTDRRLCWSIISRDKSVRTVLETRAACFTIPPQSLSHYLSQRRRWGSNAYFNAFVTLTQQNQHLVTRVWMALELTRSTLVFFRMYNFGHFVFNLVTRFSLIGVAPLLAITLLPQIWFLLFVVIPTPRYRPLLHHLLYGAVLNRLCSIVLTPTVYANVLLGFGDFRWGKSHTGANAANKTPDAADAMERGESRPCTPPKDQTEVM